MERIITNYAVLLPFQNVKIGEGKWGMDRACERGRLFTVKFLFALGKRPTYGVWFLAGRCSIPVFGFFHSQKVSLKGCIDWASGHGRLPVIKYLFDIGEDCSEEAICKAAGNGHLDVVKYLCERDKGFDSDYAVEVAARDGHIDVVKYLVEQKFDISDDSITEAEQNSHFEVVRYLKEIDRRRGYGGRILKNITKYFLRVE